MTNEDSTASRLGRQSGWFRVASWNVAHQVRPVPMQPGFREAVEALDPDLLLLNEYVHKDDLRASMLEELRGLGLVHSVVSDHLPREGGKQNNQVLAASRAPISLGSFRGPVVRDRGGETNFLHIHLEGVPIEVVGLRVPMYDDAPTWNDYWRKLGALVSEAAGRPIVFVGDFNADPDRSGIGGQTLRAFRSLGWHLPTPAGPWSYKAGTKIDHVLAWNVLAEPLARYVTEVNGVVLASSEGAPAASDHAALVVEFPGVLRLPLPAECLTASDSVSVPIEAPATTRESAGG